MSWYLVGALGLLVMLGAAVAVGCWLRANRYERESGELISWALAYRSLYLDAGGQPMPTEPHWMERMHAAGYGQNLIT